MGKNTRSVPVIPAQNPAAIGKGSATHLCQIHQEVSGDRPELAW
jgi:hypothetical protein